MKTLKVKMLNTIASSEMAWYADEEYDLDIKQAKAWEESGLCEIIDDYEEASNVPVMETAVQKKGRKKGS